MKNPFTSILFWVAALVLNLYATAPDSRQAPTSKPQVPANPQIDYAAFLRTTLEAGQLRRNRRITESDFQRMALEKGTLILDARSEDKFTLRHLKGAINLPFTDFTAGSLTKIIPSKTTRILIYCNNNFTGSPAAFASKSPAASLNLSTFVSLMTYGYTEVYELGPLLDLKTTVLPFEGTEVR